MRRFAAVTAAALLSGAALSSGTTAAQAATGPAASAAPATPISVPVIPAPAWGVDAPGAFTVHVLGGLHLKRVDTRTGTTRTTYLLCTSTAFGGAAPVIHGVGGEKDATSACEQLAAVHGAFTALAVHPTWMASAIMAPVEVRAAGTWEGAKVAWSHEYPNSGYLARATGDVFAF